MQETNNNNKRIAKNTVFLYTQMILVLVVSLYTSRVVLDVLGVDDYGIYNVVGGFIMMFGFMNSAMATASARFITFEQGTGNIERQKLVFSTSVLIHIAIALIIILIAETFGLWFVNHKMVIPESRMAAANWVYQAAILSFAISIVTVPLSSSVIAHEDMKVFAYVNVIDALLKLSIVLVLPAVSGDKLIFYSILLVVVSLLNFIIYRVYCLRRFRETRFQMRWDCSLFKQMISFAGWSFVGNFGISAKDYGVNIVLNLFCGPAINAARGVAYQVSGAINGFVSNFQMAANPQITKRYAANEIDSMNRLMRTASKFSFYLLAIIIIPVVLRADYILDLWLVDVPEYSSVFLILILIMALINSMYGPISTAMLATGKIKTYQIAVSIIMFMDVPLSYLVLKLGAAPYYVVVVGIVSAFVALFVRLYILNYEVKIDLRSFIFGVIARNLFVFVIMFLLPYYIDRFLPDTFLGLCVVSIISLIWSLIIILVLGLNFEERNIIVLKLCKVFKNIKANS